MVDIHSEKVDVLVTQGAYTGCAVGFQLQSLLSLGDLRANGGRLSLLHFIVVVRGQFFFHQLVYM